MIEEEVRGKIRDYEDRIGEEKFKFRAPTDVEMHDAGFTLAET